MFGPICLGVEYLDMFISKDNIKELDKLAQFKDPDVFSLDVDGIDFYIAKTLFDSGYRPRICVVEYNAAFGPDKCITVEYDSEFNILAAHPSQLYWGVSLEGWKKYFKNHGYQFVTVDSNGVNAFFINSSCFDTNFCQKINALEYKDSFYQKKVFKNNYEERFKLISDMNFLEIESI